MRAAGREAECTLASRWPGRAISMPESPRSRKPALDKALTLNLPAVAGRAYINLAVLYSATDPSRASEVGDRGLEMARRVGDAVCASWLHATLASSYHACSGDYEGAVEHAERSITLDRQLGLRSHLPVPMIVLAQVQQCHGNAKGAERTYLETLDLARELDDPQDPIPVLRWPRDPSTLEQGDEQARRRIHDAQSGCVRSCGDFARRYVRNPVPY